MSSTKSPKPAKRTKKAKRPTSKPKMGRPRIVINYATLKKLAALQCTDRELAAFFDTSVATIERRRQDDKKFRIAEERGRAEGMISLRRSQLQLAEKSPAMQIWLGKQWLGQVDRPPEPERPYQVIITSPGGSMIPIGPDAPLPHEICVTGEVSADEQ